MSQLSLYSFSTNPNNKTQANIMSIERYHDECILPLLSIAEQTNMFTPYEEHELDAIEKYYGKAASKAKRLYISLTSKKDPKKTSHARTDSLSISTTDPTRLPTPILKPNRSIILCNVPSKKKKSDSSMPSLFKHFSHWL